jgi:hypothetical protein
MPSLANTQPSSPVHLQFAYGVFRKGKEVWIRPERLTDADLTVLIAAFEQVAQENYDHADELKKYRGIRMNTPLKKRLYPLISKELHARNGKSWVLDEVVQAVHGKLKPRDKITVEQAAAALRCVLSSGLAVGAEFEGPAPDSSAVEWQVKSIKGKIDEH